MKHILSTTSLVMIALMIIGCDEEDERLAKMAQETTQQQAQQNQANAELARETTENQRRMVETVEKSRQDLVGLQTTVEKQQASLETERRELAAARDRESLLVPIVSSMGLLLVTSLPLVLCWYLLRGLQHEEADDEAVSRLLLQELVAEHPVLLPDSRRQAPRIDCSLPENLIPQEDAPF